MDQVADDDDRICRVCRSEASHDKPLYHPCICTGSIRYVHQDCLVQWLSHSKKEYCELCKYKYSFKPIYSPDMPSRLPVKDLVCGLFRSIFKAVKSWLHYTLVAIAWLGVVPLTACRIYKCLFTGSVASLMTLPMDLLSTAHIGRDIVQGSIVVACSMTSFIGLVWLREQIMNGGIPGWLAQGAGAEDEAAEGNAQAADPVINDDNNNVNQENVDEEGAHDVNQDIQLDQEDESSEDEEGDADTVAFLEEGSDAENENILEQDGDHQIAEEDQDDHFNEIPVVNMEEELPAPPNNQQDMLNWNALEWDRAAEELTWERMLGLDGSLVFLEHVFWVVSLNTLFILIFAFCPYHLGHFFLVGLDLDEYVIASRFEGLLTTLFGYLILTIGLFICHVAMFLLKMHRSGQVLGIFYIILKVAMLIMGEMGVFPLVCGWWLDVCSLQLLNATVQDRTRNYMNAPCTSAFFHWLIGMIYVFYFASFLLLLREVLRPGALWFLRNLNDPDFNPIQEMIHLPMYRHIRRFLLSIVIFGTAVLMVIYAPVRCIQRFLPGFLPYKVIIHRDAPVSDLSLELILLQVILPALLEQGQTRQWLKVSVWTWANLVGNFLGLKSYLLGDETDNADDQADNPQGEAPPGDPEVPPGDPEVPPGDPEVPPVPPPPFPLQQHLHPPPPMGRDGNVHQPYTKPSFFTARIILLILTMCLTLCLASLSIMVVPVGIGRYLFNLWLGVNSSHIHDLYPTALGLYVCWLFGQTIHMVLTWLPQGGKVIWSKMKQLFRTFLKTSVVLIFAIGIFPLLFGLALELVVVIPLRVPLHQTPILFLWQDWVLGILIVKLVVASTLLGPQWMVRVALERAYQQGINNFELKEFYFDVIHPILCGILLCLSVPYVLAQGVIHSFDLSFENSILLSRRIYPMLISLAAVVTFLVFEARQFRRLCDHIKNERYLVGKKLINYDPEVST